MDDSAVPTVAHGRGRWWGLAMTALAAIGFIIAAYLLAVRVAGEAPMCGPIHGCDVVAASQYATVLGLPVAFYGAAFSIVVIGAAIAWWRHGSRRALYVAYGMGLLGVLAVAYLTYLELFVIGAVCVWCVSYAATIVLGWLCAVAALRADRASAD